MSKPKVIKDYEKLTEEIIEQIKLAYPTGFSEHLISITNIDGNIIQALPFETEEKHYLIRMTVAKAELLVEEDDDFDDEGNLRPKVKRLFEEKYEDDDDSTDFVEEISIDDMDGEEFDIADESTTDNY